MIATADPSQYSDGRSVIACSSNESRFDFQGGVWFADPAVPPLNLIGGAIHTRIQSSDGLEMSNFGISVSSWHGYETIISGCEISASWPYTGDNTRSGEFDDSCEITDTKMKLDGEVVVSVSASKIELSEVTMLPHSQLRLIDSSTIKSIDINRGTLSCLGSMTSVGNLTMTGGKIEGGEGQLTGSSEEYGIWTIDSNVTLSLSNMIVDMQGIQAFKYIAKNEEGIFVESSAISLDSQQVLVRPHEIEVVWDMNGVPKARKNYTMLSGYSWSDFNSTENFAIVSPRINGVEFTMNITMDSSNGRFSFYTLVDTTRPVGSTPTAQKKKKTPYWAWIILAVGLALSLGLIVTLVLVYLLKLKKSG